MNAGEQETPSTVRQVHHQRGHGWLNALSPKFFWLTLRTRWENIEANRLHVSCATGSLVRIPAMRRN